MTNLSPAAAAVLDAYDIDSMVAALVAVADQVVPEECLARFPNDSAWQDGFTDANARIRAELLAIAAELGAQ